MGLIAMVNAHMPVDVIITRVLRRRGHPILGQLTAPLTGGLRLLTESGYLPAHSFNFRNPIQPQQFSPFSGRFIAQRFQGPNPGQCQKRQRDEEYFHGVKTLGPGKVFGNATQQPHRQERRQGAQHTPLAHIIAPLKLKRGFRQQSHRCHHPFLCPGSGYAQGWYLVADTTLGLGTGRCDLSFTAFFLSIFFRRP